jgi:hypothetical protein
MALFVTPFAYGNVQGMRMLEAKAWSDKDWDLFINWSDDQRYNYASDSDGVEITPTEYLQHFTELGEVVSSEEEYNRIVARVNAALGTNRHHINYE